MTRVFLSLGSNLEPVANLKSALAELSAEFGALVVSSAWQTDAVGFDGPAFINLAVGLNTDWPAVQLDDWLHALEDAHGRRRDVPRFSSRTLDIDIVLFGDQVIDGPGHLKVPRDELRQAFVLGPLAEIAGDVLVPGNVQTIAQQWLQHPGHDAIWKKVVLD